jgi:hypothetical protein
VERQFDTAYVLHGHQVRLATIDLAQSWELVEKRLYDLISVRSSPAASDRLQ